MARSHKSPIERARGLIEAHSIVRARDFSSAGIPLVYLKRFVDAGVLVRLGRGLYQDPKRVGEHMAHDLAEVARVVPNGVISLLSALRYHELTTELPNAVWMTIPHRSRTPSAARVRLEIVRATGEVMTAGIVHVPIEGVQVPIFGVAKTIADCFKHRRHVGDHVAIEALREALHQKKTTPGELLEFAAINRVTTQIKPLLRVIGQW